MWVTGMRKGIVYKIAKRPLDPRWSQQDVHILLGWCANGLSLGWTEDRAFQAAEAIVMRAKNYGITWPQQNLNNDMSVLMNLSEKA